MKLGRNGLWAKPDGWSRQVLRSTTRGLSYLAPKVRNLRFFYYKGIYTLPGGLMGGKMLTWVGEVWGGGVCDQGMGRVPLGLVHRRCM